MKKRKKAVRLPYLVLVPFAASVCLVIWMIFSGALMSTDEATQSLGGIFDGTSAVHWPLIPNSPTLQPLIEVLLDTPEFFVMFWNTCILTFPQLIGQFLLASPAAWAFSRFTFRGRNLLFTIYTILMLLPFQVLMVPDYLVLDRLGLMDTVWSIILPGTVSTFPVFIMKKGFDGIPVSVLEAAELDGAGAITTYIRIGLPLGIPGILSALLLSFIEAWNAIEQPLVFLKSQNLWPMSLFLANITQDDIGILWRWAWNSVGYVDCLQLLPHHLADAFLQPIRLLRCKNGLHQKLLAAG